MPWSLRLSMYPGPVTNTRLLPLSARVRLDSIRAPSGRHDRLQAREGTRGIGDEVSARM